MSAANQQADASIRQADIARRSHVAELFNTAVRQLHDEQLGIRLGAVYTLRQIGEDFPDLGGAVFELLSAYLREREKAVYYGEQAPPPDVQEMMNILTRRNASRS